MSVLQSERWVPRPSVVLQNTTFQAWQLPSLPWLLWEVLWAFVILEVCTSLCNLPRTGVSLVNEDLKIHKDVKKDRYEIPITTLGMVSWMLNVWLATSKFSFRKRFLALRML